MRLAYYAPLKSPDHAEPSGDRAMARALLLALAAGGHDVRLASTFRSRSAVPDDDRREALQAGARTEVERLSRQWREAADGWHPEAWFTYHLYYKAPDWIGPELCRRLMIPYVTAEASYAGKRDRDAWAPWQRDAAAAIRQATINFCLTAQDRAGLEQIAGRLGRLVDLPPFIETVAETGEAAGRLRNAVPVLAAVGMMRAGVKIDSYRMLAAALGMLLDAGWRLHIIGDGPARDEVVAAFSAIPPERIAWAGALAPAEVRRRLAAADVYLWPGFGEAYGMAYLEAQAAGLPVVAQRTGGITSVVRDGETGFLTGLGDQAAYAAAVRRLLSDDALRARMGRAAARFVREERTVAAAAKVLDAGLASLGGSRR